MTYEEELRAKLDAARPTVAIESGSVVDVDVQEQKMLDELDAELEFSQYDLQESDIVRTLKLLDILKRFPEAFKYPDALLLFYVLSRVGAMRAKNLHNYCKVPADDFKAALNAMARYKLLFKNSSGELELTMEGKSLASRIGVDIFF